MNEVPPAHFKDFYGIPYTPRNQWVWIGEPCDLPLFVSSKFSNGDISFPSYKTSFFPSSINNEVWRDNSGALHNDLELVAENGSTTFPIRMILSPYNISFSCYFMNSHHRCCWPRTVFDTAISEIIEGRCNPGSQDKEQKLLFPSSSTSSFTTVRSTKEMTVSLLESVRHVCEELSTSIKVFKKKPIVYRKICYFNAVPPILREPVEDTNVYVLNGEVKIEIVVPCSLYRNDWNAGISEKIHEKCGLQEANVKGNNRNTDRLSSAALLSAPDFLFMTPSENSQRFLYAYLPSHRQDSKCYQHQLLLLQDVQPVHNSTNNAFHASCDSASSTPGSTRHFEAKYTPFSWVLTTSAKQQYSGKQDLPSAVNPRKVQQRTKGRKRGRYHISYLVEPEEKMNSFPSSICLEFTFHGVYLIPGKRCRPTSETPPAHSHAGSSHDPPSAPITSTLLQMVSSLHSYHPYRTRSSLFAVESDPLTRRNTSAENHGDRSKDESKKRKATDRRRHRLLNALDEELLGLGKKECLHNPQAFMSSEKRVEQSSDILAESSGNIVESATNKRIDDSLDKRIFFGALKTARPLLVEKCEHQNAPHLISIFPNSFPYPFRLSPLSVSGGDTNCTVGLSDNEKLSATELPPTCSLSDVASLLKKEITSLSQK